MSSPIGSRRSFHSMHATWQALQPMHLVVSISLATPPPEAGSSRAVGGCTVVAETRRMSSDCSAMAGLLCLLDVDEERFELRRVRVAVADRWRERVGQVTRPCHAHEVPVQRYFDLVHGAPFDR